MSGFANIMLSNSGRPPAATVTDGDAQLFVNAVYIVNQSQANAIDNLVIGLKTDGIWASIRAYYPFIGGTADKHKWNLKDPRDLDAAFRMTWIGTPTHNSSGVARNGSGGGNTNIYLPSVLSRDSASIYVYASVTEPINNIMGASDGGANWFGAGAGLYSGLMVNTDTNSSTPPLSGIGFAGASRTGSNATHRVLGNTTYSYTHAATLVPNSYVGFLGFYNPSNNFSGSGSGTYGSFIIATGLTTTQSTNLANRTIAYNAALGR